MADKLKESLRCKLSVTLRMLLRFASLKTSGQSFCFSSAFTNHCAVLNKQGVGGGKGLNTQRFLSCLDEVLLSGENDQRLFFIPPASHKSNNYIMVLEGREKFSH